MKWKLNMISRLFPTFAYSEVLVSKGLKHPEDVVIHAITLTARIDFKASWIYIIPLWEWVFKLFLRARCGLTDIKVVILESSRQPCFSPHFCGKAFLVNLVYLEGVSRGSSRNHLSFRCDGQLIMKEYRNPLHYQQFWHGTGKRAGENIVQMEGGRGRKIFQVEASAFLKTHRQEKAVLEKWECR